MLDRKIISSQYLGQFLKKSNITRLFFHLGMVALPGLPKYFSLLRATLPNQSDVTGSERNDLLMNLKNFLHG